jgi:simple sugar transport system permease protein
MKKLAPWLVALAVCVLSLNVAIWLAGGAPLQIAWLALVGAAGSVYGVAQTLAKATPLILTGTSVAFALRAGLFNVGAEGQVAVGVLTAALVGPKIPQGIHWLLGASITAVCCALTGGAWGAIPGWLKAKRGAHEVLTTLMLNGLMSVIATYLYGGPLRMGAQIHTQPVSSGARIAGFDHVFHAMRGSSLSWVLFMALALPWLARWYLERTRGGLRIRALGHNARAAAAVGIDVGQTTVRTMAISGAIAALCGVHYVLGFKGYAEDGLGAGVGFAGIAVAMLGGRSPLALIGAALLFAALAQGGLTINALVPSDTLALVQAMVLLSVGAVIGQQIASTKREGQDR